MTENKYEAYEILCNKALKNECSIVLWNQHFERKMCFCKNVPDLENGKMYNVLFEQMYDVVPMKCIVKEIDVSKCKSLDEMLVKADLSQF